MLTFRATMMGMAAALLLAVPFMTMMPTAAQASYHDDMSVADATIMKARDSVSSQALLADAAVASDEIMGSAMASLIGAGPGGAPAIDADAMAIHTTNGDGMMALVGGVASSPHNITRGGAVSTGFLEEDWFFPPEGASGIPRTASG